MAVAVTMGAMCTCNMGVAPSSLMVLPTKKVLGENKPMATIMDNKPFVNILPFAMCNSKTNPAVIAATAAAAGVPTPAPCTPATAAPWTPGSPTVMVGNVPALSNSSKLVCTLGGVISITNPGCMKVQVK